MLVARKSKVLCVFVLLVHTVLVATNAYYASRTEPDALFVIVWTPVAILDFPVTAIWFVIEKILGAFDLGIISGVVNLSTGYPSWVTNVLFIGFVYLVFGGWFWFWLCCWLSGGKEGKGDKG
jgi:hypothetical protein